MSIFSWDRFFPPAAPAAPPISEKQRVAEILGAASRGDASRVRELALLHGAVKTGLDVPGDSEQTTLQTAINNKNPDLALALLEAGADPSALNIYGRDTLSYALSMGYDDVYAALLKKGARVNLTFTQGSSLSDAIRCKNVEIVKQLLAVGQERHLMQDVDLVSWMKNILGSPGEKSRQILDAFLEAGADPKAYDKDGCSMLYLAAESKNPRMVEAILQKGVDANTVNSRRNKDFPLIVAAYVGGAEVVKMLLEAGADPWLREDPPDRRTALDCLIAYRSQTFRDVAGMEECAKLLIPTMFDEKRWQQKTWAEADAVWKTIPEDWQAYGKEAMANLARDFRSRQQAATPALCAVPALEGRKGALMSTFNLGPLFQSATASPLSEKELAAEIVLAALHGSASRVRELTLQHGPVKKRLDELGVDGQTILQRAILDKKPDLALALLEAGASPNATDINGADPLSFAAAEGYTDVFNELLKRGARLKNAFAKYGHLSDAISGGHVEIVRQLLDLGRERGLMQGVDFVSWMTMTFEVPGENAPQILNLLFDAGADPKSYDENGWSMLYLAAESKNPGTVEAILQKGVDANTLNKSEGKLFPLIGAGYVGSAEVMKVLLKAGANPWAREAISQQTTLDCMIARRARKLDTKEGKTACAQLLVPAMFDEKYWQKKTWAEVEAAWKAIPEDWQAYGKEAKANLARDFRSRQQAATPALCAAQVLEGRKGILMSIFNLGPLFQPATAPRPSETQLAAKILEAASQGDASRVRELTLQYGPVKTGLDAQGGGGRTALQAAILSKKPDLALALLEAGADPNAKDVNLADPLFYAVAYGHADVSAQLLQRGAQLGDIFTQDGRFSQAIRYGYLEIVKQFIALCQERPLMQSVDFVPLMTLAFRAPGKDGPQILNLLLEAGADAKSCDKNGWSMLDLAAESKNPGMVEAILQKGVDANTTGKGHSLGFPLRTATYRGNVEVVKALLKAGANPWMRDKTSGQKTLLECLIAERHMGSNNPEIKEDCARLLVPAMFDEKYWQKKTWAEVEALWKAIPEDWQACGKEAMANLARDFRSRQQAAIPRLLRRPGAGRA